MNLLYRSIQLDFHHLVLPISVVDKLTFIYKKYWLLVQTMALKIPIRHCRIWGKSFWFEDNFGVAFLQSVLVDNYFLKEFIDKQGFIVDIGANVGQFALFCHQYLSPRHVVCFEPLLQTYQRLKNNCPEYECWNQAVTTNSSLVLQHPGLSLLASSQSTGRYKEVVRGIELGKVQSIIDAATIDLLKIDVEGGEGDVLKACESVLYKTSHVLIEVSIDRESDSDLVSTISFLKDHRFIIRRIGQIFYSDKNQVAVDILFAKQQ